MADSYLPYQDPTTVSRKLDSEAITVGANTVERERIQIAGKADTGIAEVLGEAPSSGSLGIVVRNIASGSQAVTGTVNVANGSIQLLANSTIKGITDTVNVDVKISEITDGTLNTVYSVANLVDGTLSTVSKVTTGSIQLDPLSHVTVQNIKGGTLTTLSSLTTGSVQLDPLSHVTVSNIKQGTLTTVGTVTSVTAVASVTTGSIQLDPLSHVTVTNLKQGTLTTLSNLTSGSIQLLNTSTIKGITDTVNVNASMTMGSIPGGTINNLVTGSIQLDPRSWLAGITDTIKTTAAMTMGSIPGGTIDVVTKITNGSIQLDPLSHVTVTNIKQGTLTTVGTVSALTTGSVQLDPLSHVTVANLKGGTLTTVSNVVTGSIQLDPNSAIAVVKNINGGTITTVASVTNVANGSINVYNVNKGSIQTVAGSQTVVSNIAGGTITTVASLTTGSVQVITGSRIYVSNCNDGTISTVARVTSGSIQITDGTEGALVDTAGNLMVNLGVKLSGATDSVSIGPTLMSAVSGATTGAGTTYIQAAVASKKIKVYAYDLTTTTNTYFQVKFAGYDGVALAAHGLVSATLNVVSGIAKSVNPPAYLFSTAAGSTLTLISSAAQPLNYNISYWTADAV